MSQGPQLETEHLPADLRQTAIPAASAPHSGSVYGQGLEQAVAVFEQQMIRQALDTSEGNVVKAASLLKIPRGTLRYKMEKYGL